jgi:hypothetical protein
MATSLHSLHCRTQLNWFQSQSHIATDGQSISKSWCRAPSGAIDQIFITYSLTFTVLFLWGALSDERTRDHILLSQIWDFPWIPLSTELVSQIRFFITTLHGPNIKHRSQQSHFCRGVFTDLLLRNGLHNPAVLLLSACMLRVLPSNGYLAMGL